MTQPVSNVTAGPTAEFELPGFPGQNGVIVAQPIFPAGDARNEGGPEGLPGEYEVVFTFARLGQGLRSERSIISGDQLVGNSHLQIPQRFEIDALCDGEKLHCVGAKNDKGFLSSINVKCDANSLLDAHSKCYKAVTPVLSQFTLRWDVPLFVYQIDVVELRRGTRLITHRNPFLEVTVHGIFGFAVDPELRAYASVHREALTTESITYQFLCLFRIIESIPKRRKKLEREAKRRGKPYTSPNEIYPATRQEALELLNSLYPAKPPKGWDDDEVLKNVLVPEAQGKPFTEIIDCLASIRDNIAHTLIQRADELVSIDDPSAIQKIERWLPVVKCIARSMLKNDFQTELA